MSRRLPAIVLMLVAACGGKVASVVGDDAGVVDDRTPPEYSSRPNGTAPAPTGSTTSGPGYLCSQSRITVDCPTNEGYSISSARGRTPSAAERHVIQMNEARADHSVGFHPRGSVAVHISRPGHHELVLGSYEPVDFVIAVDPGAIVDRVTLDGHGKHTAQAPSGTVIDDESGSGPSCYDATTCQPVLSNGYTDFAGCYRITKIDIGDEPQPCSYPAMPWERFEFTYDRAETDCAGGDRYVKYNANYGKWVGAQLCSNERYKLFLGETKDGAFHEIGDSAGNGQDHCELVNPNFTIPNEDDITSGTCKTCANQVGSANSPGPVPVYLRDTFGTPFNLTTWPVENVYTSRWYECGVSIGN